MESVNEQQPKQKFSIFSTASAPASRKQPTGAAFIAASSRTPANGSNTISSGGSVAGTLPNNQNAHPLTRTSIAGSVPRRFVFRSGLLYKEYLYLLIKIFSLEAIGNNGGGTLTNQQQAPYPQNPYGFHDMHAFSFHARGSNIPLGFDSHFHSQNNQHQFEPLNRWARLMHSLICILILDTEESCQFTR